MDSAQSPNDSFSDASAIEFRDAHTKIAKELADTTRRIPEPVSGSADLRGVQLNIDDTEGAAQLCAENDVGISAGDVLTTRGNEFDFRRNMSMKTLVITAILSTILTFNLGL